MTKDNIYFVITFLQSAISCATLLSFVILALLKKKKTMQIAFQKNSYIESCQMA